MTANATLLLPVLQPEAMITSVTAGRTTLSLPKLHVIVSGSMSSARALVMHGRDATSKKTKFLFADKGANATEALENLLDVTMHLIRTNSLDDTCVPGAVAVKAAGGGYISLPKASPSSAEDVMFWGNSAETSPIFPTNVSFKSTASSNNSDHVYLNVNNPGANVPAYQIIGLQGAQGAGSVLANGTSPNGSFAKTNGSNANGNPCPTGLGVNSMYGTNNGPPFMMGGRAYVIDAGVNGSFGKNESFQSNGGAYANPVGMNGSFCTAT